MQPTTDVRSLGIDPPLASRLAGVLELPGRLRASAYLSVGTSARFRAHQRRRTVTAARMGFLVITVASLFDASALIDRGWEEALLLLVLNGGVALLGVAGWWLLAHGCTSPGPGRGDRDPGPRR